jgi:serine/threonine protein kinase
MTTDEIENEERVATKLCKLSAKHIVCILRHGRLDHSMFYLDMELCQLNLATYIARKWTQQLCNQIPHLTADFSLGTRVPRVKQIMLQISNGISFLHFFDEVHRDLKPQNGTTLSRNGS